MKDQLPNPRYESITRGYYTPSFFKLRVNVFEDLIDPEKLEPAPQSTFFHEYIHFLQDVTTTYGLGNSSIVVNKMKFANHAILGNKEPGFKLPINYSQDGMIMINDKLQRLYLGHPYTYLDGIVINKVIKTRSDIWIAPYNKYAPIIKVQLADFQKTTFGFGAIHIMETMCHLAQQIYDPSIDHCDVPYKTAELVAKRIYPVIGNNPFYLFALCDASLMHLHPGDFFFENLRMMSTASFIPASEEEIYDFVYRQMKTSDGKNMVDIFEEQVDLAISQLTGYFTTENYDNEKIWITHVLNSARTLRLNEPTFMLSLIKQQKLYSDKLKEIMLLLGTPLLQNLDEKCWFHYPLALKDIKISPERFAAILEIHQLFFGAQKKCDLKKFCDTSLIGSTTDARCDNAPWERGMDLQQCSYAQLWKTWGLNSKYPL